MARLAAALAPAPVASELGASVCPMDTPQLPQGACRLVPDQGPPRSGRAQEELEGPALGGAGGVLRGACQG